MSWCKSATAAWSKFYRLSWSERCFLFQALVLLPLTALALWWLGFRRWQSALSYVEPISGVSTEADEVVRVGHAYAIARLVKAAASHGPYHATCLEQSLTLWWLLRRRGINGHLRIGVRKEADRVEAHAWVEIAGVVVNDSDDVHLHFACFDRAIVSGQANPC